MRVTMKRKLASLLICSSFAWAAQARADAVVDWNVIAIQAIGAAVSGSPPRPGPPTAIDLAKVHAAVHDAVQAIEGRYEPYHAQINGASGSSSAAAATAAHDVLVALFPAQQAGLDTTYANYLANNGLATNDPGVSVGTAAAADIIALRANDGAFPAVPPPPFVGGTNLGQWRPTPSYLPGNPPSFAPMAAPWGATVTPFTLTSPSQFRAEPPPALTSALYTRHYQEVKRLGSLNSSRRTSAATDKAYFWTDNFLFQWNRVLQSIATSRRLSIADSARLFALTNLSIADAFITAWDSKIYHAFWRPVTAIQEGANDGNPATEGEPNWQPLINTPNYPDYTSGANNVIGAATRTLQRFLGTDKVTFSVTSNVPVVVQKTRTFKRLSHAAREVVEARVLLGIHFRFADTAARAQGRSVADWAFDNYLRPID